MDDFTQEIELMLKDVDRIVQETEKLRGTMIISVREWQVAYIISVLVLIIDSTVKRHRNEIIRVCTSEKGVQGAFAMFYMWQIMRSKAQA
jgi:hypothetical protein